MGQEVGLKLQSRSVPLLLYSGSRRLQAHYYRVRRRCSAMSSPKLCGERYTPSRSIGAGGDPQVEWTYCSYRARDMYIPLRRRRSSPERSGGVSAIERHLEPTKK